MTPEELALSRAKIQLMRIPNTIFYTTILFSLKQKWTDKIQTAATDGKMLYINKEFFLGLTEKERIGLLVHELLHVALSHMTRRKDRDKRLWNVAGDYVINLSMCITNRYTLPQGALLDKKFTDQSTEAVYKIIYEEEKEEEKKQGQTGANGLIVPGGEDIQYPQDSIEASVIEAAIASTVLKASIQAKAENSMPGELPKELEIHLNQMINPILPWNVILQNYLTGFAQDDYSWQKPNRRYLPEYYLPSTYSESLREVVIAVDSSGSVSTEEFSHFIKEISSIQETLKPDKLTIIDFDTEIKKVHNTTLSTDIMKDIRFTGGGGTDILPIFKWTCINNPEFLIIFTDGEFHIPDRSYYPSIPVIWIINNNPYFKPPLGEVIHYEIKEF